MDENTEQLRLEYVPLSRANLWESNLKLHDIGAVIQSIKQHGFKDPPKYEPSLNNGAGGLVEGNGRTEALIIMRQNGDKPPRGIVILEDGDWLIPVLFGVDASSEKAAHAYGIDHNATTMGGDFDIGDHLRNWQAGFVYQLMELQKEGIKTAVFDGQDIQKMLEWELVDRPDIDTILNNSDDISDIDFWPVLREKVSPSAFQKIQRLKRKIGNDELALNKIIEAIDENLFG